MGRDVNLAGYILLFQSTILLLTLLIVFLQRKSVDKIMLWTRCGVITYSILSLTIIFFVDRSSFSANTMINNFFESLNFSFVSKIFILFNIISGSAYLIYIRRISSFRVFKCLVMMLMGQAITNLIILQTNLFLKIVLLELLFVPIIIHNLLAEHKKGIFQHIVLMSVVFLGVAISFDKDLLDFSSYSSDWLGLVIFTCLVMAISFKGLLFEEKISNEDNEEVGFIKEIFHSMIYIPAIFTTLFSILNNFDQLFSAYSDFFYSLLFLLFFLEFIYSSISSFDIDKRRLLRRISYLIVLMGLWTFLVDPEKSASSLLISLYIYAVTTLSSFVLTVVDNNEEQMTDSFSLYNLMIKLLDGNLGIIPPFGLFIALVIFGNEIYNINSLYGTILLSIVIILPLIINDKFNKTSVMNSKKTKRIEPTVMEEMFVYFVAIFSLGALFFLREDLLSLMNVS
jgi:hypothetical protein